MEKYHVIKLSDGEDFRVPILGIFELDDLRPKPIGPFTYEMEMAGKTYEVEYDMTQWVEPPEKPDMPENEIKTDTPEWFALQNWRLYKAALVHEERRMEQQVDFVEKVAKYILKKCPDDINRIATPEDWQKVYKAALVPQLNMSILAETLEKTYQAEFEGVNVLVALQNIERDNSGKYDTIRVWESELMMRMQMTELEYALMPLQERARKVCSLFLPDLMQALQYEKDKQKRDAKKSRS